MKKNTKIALLVVIVLFIAGMAFYPAIQKRFFQKEKPGNALVSSSTRGEGKSENALNVNVIVVRAEDLVDAIESTGTLIPDEEVDLSFETSGKITHIYFKEGSSVKKGDLLAKVNDSPLQAELKKLEAQIPLAEDRVFRQKALLAKDAVSKEAFEQVSTELDKLKADIELVKSHINQTELRAPFDGVIGLRAVSEGTYASPSTIIAILTKIIPLKIEFSVNEAHANQIHQGTSLDFIIGDLNVYHASVYAVESKIDIKTRTLKVRAIYPNSNGYLKPGRTAYVKIKSNEIKNALTAPNEAIITEMGRNIGYLYQGGKAKLVELSKGLRSESKIHITEGLQPGDTLITTGIMQLRDGLPVKIDHIINN